jgi:hypothetical protein
MITRDYLRLDAGLPKRVNLLLTGPGPVTEGFVKAFRPHLQDPVVILRRGEPFALPTAPFGTLFLADVGALTLEEQRRLYDWLEDRSSGMQVISVSATSLMPMVAAGTFLEGLYYRLNTIYVDVTAVPSERAARVPAMRSV